MFCYLTVRCVWHAFKLATMKDTTVCFHLLLPPFFAFILSSLPQSVPIIQRTYRLDSLQKIGGGFCDCGDPHSWKTSGFCPKHKPVTGSVSSSQCRFTDL